MKKKLINTIILLLLISSVEAQQYMTLKDARRMALAKSEDLKIAEATLAKSEHEKNAAKTNYFPSISASASGVYMFDNLETEMYLPTYTPDASGTLQPNVVVDESGQTVVGADGNPLFNMYAFLPVELSLKGAYLAGVKIEQPIYTGGKISAGNRMAEIGVEMATENIGLQRMKTVVEVDQAYWLYVSVQSKVKLARENLDMLTALLKRVNDSYEVGMVDKNEVLKVQVKYDKARLDMQKAQSGFELSRMSLCRVTGLSFDTTIQTDSVIVIDDSLFVQMGNEDVTMRPEYRLLQKKVELEEKRIDDVRSDHMPTLGVSAGYNYLGNVEFDDGKINQGNFNVMAQLKIPLVNWGEGRQMVKASQMQKEIREQELAKNTDLMRLEIEKARFNLKDAALRVQISEDGLKQAAENLRVSNDNYEVGRELLSDLLVAQTEWAKASNEVLDAKTNFKLQETEYLRVTAALPTGEGSGVAE